MITFGICCYNGSDLLDKCLLALTGSIQQASNLDDYQIIIYDDGSSDDNIQIIAKKYHAIWIKEPINKGLVYGYNVVSELAKHDIICLLDNDVAVMENFVSEMLNNIDKEYGVIGYESMPVSRFHFLGKISFEPFLKPSLAFKTPTTQLAGYCYCFHKDDWEAIGGFDERYRMFLADSDFCCMIADKLGKISLRLNYPKVFHIEHETLYKYDELKWKEQLKKDTDYFIKKWGLTAEEMDWSIYR